MKINHLSPLCCAVCGYRACYEELPVCRYCASKMQAFLTQRCRVCGKTPENCKCATGESVRFIMFFHSLNSKMVLYRLKYNFNPKQTYFFGDLMVRASGIRINSFDGVTYVPRRRKNIKKYGYDQSKLLATAIARIYGIPLLELLERKGGSDQKLLDGKGRFRSAKKKYLPKNIPQEKYKKILLIDDIATTGATIKACAEILRANSAKAVVPLVIAKTMPLK